jgi:PPK2 family polyphosphate:nucleotide phosphotransferase
MSFDPRVRPGDRVRLKDWPTRIAAPYRSKGHASELLQAQVERLSALQNRLYAANSCAILIIFQAMDAAGKDGAIAHVMSGVNPQGCQVTSFKHPSAEEQQHDFLWRTTRRLPERGQIGIFNRSYYEEVLIARVHPEILASEGLPDSRIDAPHVWRHRYRSINDLERHLHRNGTHVLKFFLHLSKEEQRLRFIDRIDDPAKNWKFSEADIAERAHWGDYRRAYEACLSATSSTHAPWYVVPADDKRTTRLIVAQTIVDYLESLDLACPAPDPVHRAQLLSIRAGLVSKGRGTRD